MTFQSRFGYADWLQPYTEPTLVELAARGHEARGRGVPRIRLRLPGDAGGDRHRRAPRFSRRRRPANSLTCLFPASTNPPNGSAPSRRSRAGDSPKLPPCPLAYKVLVFGASYGSLFGTKVAAAGHDATLICQRATAELINREGTKVQFPVARRRARSRSPRARCPAGCAPPRPWPSSPRVRPGGARDAGAAVRRARRARAARSHREGRRALPLAHEHAAAALPAAHSRPWRRTAGRVLHRLHRVAGASSPRR